MNNLLRTLTENQRRPSPDLKLLLNTVKDVRRLALDSKASDPFYESLEGLLLDLRTVTMDNRDAEAFLKPVSRAEVPDYHEVISNPMDLQTMLKKVKQKHYKSKREFKDDLDLMWSNCFTYNSTKDHPLRLCAIRLKKKAERLLMHITDNRDRIDPPVPGEPSHHTTRPVARLKLNGLTPHDNKDRDTTPNDLRSQLPGTASTRHTTNGHSNRLSSTCTTESRPRKQVSFADSPALIRTQQGMSAFRDLDLGLAQLLDATDFQMGEPGPSTLSHARRLADRLRHHVMPPEVVDDEDAYSDINTDSDVKMETLSDTGEKRKLMAPYLRQAKRPRLTPPDSGDEIDAKAETLLRPPRSHGELIDLWWNAAQSDALLANGLPCLPSIASSPLPQRPPPRKAPIVNTPVTTTTAPSAPTTPRKRRVRPVAGQERSETLLSLMNTNIKTLKRVRRTHTKFAALGFNAGEDGAGTGGAPGVGLGVGGTEREDIPDPETELPEEVVDGRPWLLRLRGAGGKTVARGGIEIGERAAGSCLKWMNRKVLEHVGFQGTSNAALDDLTGVASEFLLNLGRTLRFLCDKYARTMTPEELILHALFESGTTRIQDLERYIKDDIVRHGARLVELEKKLENAYREATSTDVLDDDALFNSDQEEDDGLAMGAFADTLGEDFLGLRELGIAAELGLSSLSVPRKLLKGKKDATGGVKAKPAEVQLPYPPPPPFIPITSKNVEDQIGLLRPYYHQRLSSLAVTAPVVSADIPNASLPGTKVNPIGQVVKPSLAATTVKKKGKGKEGGGGVGTSTSGVVAGVGVPLPVTAVLQSETVADGGSVTGAGAVEVEIAAGDGAGKGGTGGGKSANVSPRKKERMADLPPVIAARG
ncbi:hypothetical protein F5J12DRAFT_830397 [Pisolithus orientalis]|uniref:uncharacterized protein n=1 Tax=Pisolithus orientalis TaxID=936130 RepID=UPI002224E3F1|nr:uncharacterized protein F5J12DRAFT_830397 [Pisolithus orientalis]KAI6007732.1 hypothetical protein F5J12DRAFT_830397 [Pisolithus orientalis]